MMIDDFAHHAAAAWVVAAVALGIAELAIPGVFLIFLAIAAAITGLATFALPDLPLIVQGGSFAAWSVVSVLIGRRCSTIAPRASSGRPWSSRSRSATAPVARCWATAHGRRRGLMPPPARICGSSPSRTACSGWSR